MRALFKLKTLVGHSSLNPTVAMKYFDQNDKDYCFVRLRGMGPVLPEGQR